MAGSERGDAVADTASERPKTTRLPERISVPMISGGHRVVLAGEAFGALAVVPCIAPDPRSRPGQAGRPMELGGDPLRGQGGTARGFTWVLAPTIGTGRTVLPSGWFFATRDQAIGALSHALDRIADRWLASGGVTDDPARLLPASRLFADAADREARLAATVGGSGCPLPDKRARDKGDRWRAGRVDVVDVRMEIETLRRAAAFGGAIMGPLHGLRRLTLSIDWPAANAMLAAMKAEGRGEAPRIVINLNDFNLSGGITDIDLDLEQIVPDGTSVTYEIQIGGDWVPVDFVASGNHPLYGLPASVNARMVLLGTTQLMPGVKIGESYRTLSRPRTDGVHISAVRTAPANVDEVHVVATLEHFDDTPHDCTVSLLVGGAYDTEVAASSVSDTVLPDGSTRRTWVFSGLAPTQTWKRKTTIGTSSALSVFLVSEMTDFSFAA